MTEDDFERLSRYRAGELTPAEARSVEGHPGFAEGMRQLERLEAATAALPVALAPEQLSALLAKVRRPPPPGQRRRDFRVGLAVLLAGLAVALLILRPREPVWTLRGSGEVTVDGEAVSERRQVAAGSTVRTGETGSAQLTGPLGWIGLPAQSQLSTSGGRFPALTRGNAIVSSQGLLLSAGDTELEVHGLAVLSMEPPEGVARVTGMLDQTPPGALLKTQWLKLSSVAVTAAAAGAALTLFVVEGSALARQGGDTPAIELKAGERWKAGEGRPTSFRAAAPEQASQPVAVTAAGDSLRRTDAELAKLSRPELIAMVTRLADEKEALLKERSALKTKLDGQELPHTSAYRASPEELNELAKQGTFRLRGTQLAGREWKVDDRVRDDLRLRPEEVAAAKAIVQASTQRVHEGLLALYTEIGGDPSLAGTLASLTLFNEIQSKSLKDEWTAAIRQVANERAGQPRPEGTGSAMLRAVRLLCHEDDWVLDEFDRLLGPGRAEQFVNHEYADRNSTSYGAGPAPAP